MTYEQASLHRTFTFQTYSSCRRCEPRRKYVLVVKEEICFPNAEVMSLEIFLLITRMIIDHRRVTREQRGFNDFRTHAKEMCLSISKVHEDRIPLSGIVIKIFASENICC